MTEEMTEEELKEGLGSTEKMDVCASSEGPVMAELYLMFISKCIYVTQIQFKMAECFVIRCVLSHQRTPTHCISVMESSRCLTCPPFPFLSPVRSVHLELVGVQPFGFISLAARP